MYQQLLHLSRRLVLALIVGLSTLSLLAQTESSSAPVKDIFLLDVSASMAGRGSGATAKIFEQMQSELSAVLSKARDRRIVLIPFGTHTFPAYSGQIPEDSTALHQFLAQLTPRAGRTDIARAWLQALDSLSGDSNVANERLYVISDGLHNSREISADSLLALLAKGARGRHASLVLLDRGYDDTPVANAFRSSPNTDIIYTLDGLYDGSEATAATPRDTISSDTISTATENAPVKAETGGWGGRFFSLWWLWLLLLIIAAFLALKFLGKGLASLGGFSGGAVPSSPEMGGSDPVDVFPDSPSVPTPEPTEPTPAPSAPAPAPQPEQDPSANVYEEAASFYATHTNEGIHSKTDFSEIPATGNGNPKQDENKERRTIQELLDDPYKDSRKLYEEAKPGYKIAEGSESDLLIKRDLAETKERTSSLPNDAMPLNNGEANFWNYRLGNVVVKAVTAEEIIAQGKIKQSDLDKNPKELRKMIKKVIRKENYSRLQVALVKRYHLPESMKGDIIGALLHCVPHEDINGYVYLVRVPLHIAFDHDGAASAVATQVYQLLLKGK